MGTFSAILGGVGGLSAVMGIITALGVVDKITDEMTWVFWFVLAVILLLGSLALKPSTSSD
jgi:uncharacterized protein (TIGR00251 family)